jgi:membrane protease YdiL (CAAX protease family)
VGAATLVVVIVAALATIAGSLLLALANQPYFDVVNGYVGAREAVPRALVFSSWLVVIGGPFVLWRPATFGFSFGDVRKHWLDVVVACAIAAAVTAVLLKVSGQIPYSDASVFVETVLVPVTEEMVFRGVLLAILLAGFGRLYQPGIAVPLAIIVNGVAFGVAHLANATSLDIGFVAPRRRSRSRSGSAAPGSS